MKTNYPELIREMIKQTREDNQDLIDEMPDKAKTKGQRDLKKKHGTPQEFAKAVVNAIGEISCLEAHTAIEKYEQEWNKP